MYIFSVNFPVISGYNWLSHELDKFVNQLVNTWDNCHCLIRRLCSSGSGWICQHSSSRRSRGRRSRSCRHCSSSGRTGTGGSCWNDNDGHDGVWRSSPLYCCKWTVLLPSLHNTRCYLPRLMLTLWILSICFYGFHILQRFQIQQINYNMQHQLHFSMKFIQNYKIEPIILTGQETWMIIFLLDYLQDPLL